MGNVFGLELMIMKNLNHISCYFNSSIVKRYVEEARRIEEERIKCIVVGDGDRAQAIRNLLSDAGITTEETCKNLQNAFVIEPLPTEMFYPFRQKKEKNWEPKYF